MTDVTSVGGSDLDREIMMALDERFGSGSGTMAVSSTSTADAKKLFCDNWPMVKQVLQVIPGIPGWIKAAVITAGDLAHGRLCQGG